MSLRHLTACPGCTSTRSPRRLFSMPMAEDTCKVVRCADCGLVFKDLIPSSDGMTDIYTDGYVHFQPEAADSRDVHSARDKLARVTALLPARKRGRPLRIVDFGCGRGGFVRIARSLGHEAFGVDPFMPDAVQSEWLRRGTPESLEPASYDLVVMLNVAEHLPDPRATFTAIRRALAPDGGVLLLTCPYGGSVARRVYRAAWSHMSYDEHILFWTPRSLTTMLRDLGFAGRARHRVLGAPFPYGRVPTAQGTVTAAVATPATAAPAAPPPPKPWQRVQSQVWRLARTIQKSPELTTAVRRAMNASRIGDYLELAIATARD